MAELGGGLRLLRPGPRRNRRRTGASSPDIRRIRRLPPAKDPARCRRGDTGETLKAGGVRLDIVFASGRDGGELVRVAGKEPKARPIRFSGHMKSATPGRRIGSETVQADRGEWLFLRARHRRQTNGHTSRPDDPEDEGGGHRPSAPGLPHRDEERRWRRPARRRARWVKTPSSRSTPTPARRPGEDESRHVQDKAPRNHASFRLKPQPGGQRRHGDNAIYDRAKALPGPRLHFPAMSSDPGYFSNSEDR